MVVTQRGETSELHLAALQQARHLSDRFVDRTCDRGGVRDAQAVLFTEEFNNLYDLYRTPSKPGTPPTNFCNKLVILRTRYWGMSTPEEEYSMSLMALSDDHTGDGYFQFPSRINDIHSGATYQRLSLLFLKVDCHVFSK